MTTADGKAAPGDLSTNHAAWAPGAVLDHGMTYRPTATAADDGGLTATKKVTFTTLTEPTASPAPTARCTASRSGRACRPRSPSTSPSPTRRPPSTAPSRSGQPVVGHWFGGRRRDFRPQQ
ncbi:Ig-like domain-containing protein [Streptomyces cavernae]|uniref:Ig-like domain-containing protein n=1 Tax=Streptomyces cavernae TaxID=2259034 RepID=UPI002368A5E7|nr:Ig-like domain-containing protein [Streptomyces cavernae]